MIPYRSNRLTALPRSLATRLEILKAIRALAAQDDLRKYDPDEPRVPAGNPDGGQWTSETDTDVSAIVAEAKHLNLAGDPDVYQKCLDLCYPLLERIQPPWSDRNTWDFHKCMNACLGRNL